MDCSPTPSPYPPSSTNPDEDKTAFSAYSAVKSTITHPKRPAAITTQRNMLAAVISQARRFTLLTVYSTSCSIMGCKVGEKCEAVDINW